MKSHWREQSSRVISEAIQSGVALGLEGDALERHVSAAYPFGAREMHPYKIWLSEVRFQLGKVGAGRPKRDRGDLPGQLVMFGDRPWEA